MARDMNQLSIVYTGERTDAVLFVTLFVTLADDSLFP